MRSWSDGRPRRRGYERTKKLDKEVANGGERQMMAKESKMCNVAGVIARLTDGGDIGAAWVLFL